MCDVKIMIFDNSTTFGSVVLCYNELSIDPVVYCYQIKIVLENTDSLHFKVFQSVRIALALSLRLRLLTLFPRLIALLAEIAFRAHQIAGGPQTDLTIRATIQTKLFKETYRTIQYTTLHNQGNFKLKSIDIWKSF